MPSERKLHVSLSMKIKGESTSVKVLPWDPFATFRAEGTNTTNKEIKSSCRRYTRYEQKNESARPH
jgi:hypothetical protein